MEYDIFFECISCFVYKIYMYIRIVRINLSSAFVNRQEYRFDTGSCLCHQTGSSGWSNCQAGNVTATVFLHVLIQFRVSCCQALDERIILFTFAIVYFESTTFFGHFHWRTVCAESYCLVYFFREFCRFFRSVTQSQCSKHITFCSDTYTSTATLSTLLVDFLPKCAFCMFYFFIFRIFVNLGHDTFDFLEFEVDDIIHDTLSKSHVFLEQVKIKISIRFERIHYIGI